MRSNLPLPRSGAALAASLRWIGAVAFYGAAGLVALVCLALLVVRLWLVPRLDEYREPILKVVAAAVGQPVSAGTIEVGWDGWNPTLALHDFVIYGEDGRPGLRLPLVRNTLSWRSLLGARLRLTDLELVAPELELRRDAQGALHVGGMRLQVEGKAEDRGFVAWLLRQPRVRVRDGVVVWRDESRSAPPLELESVHVRLDNRGAQHRFGLTGVPPGDLSAPIDLRGNLRFTAGGSLGGVSGRLYARLDFVDLARWGAWVDVPFELASGLGALRLWLDIEGGAPRSATADVELGEVRARLARGLPQLDLSSIEGRIAWRQTAERATLTATGLGFVTARGMSAPPTDLSLTWALADDPVAREGELAIGTLPLAPLEHLAMHLPISDAWRARIRELRPRGTLSGVRYAWHGDPMGPERYALQVRFSGLGVSAGARVPAIGNASGTLEATEEGGSATVAGEGLVAEIPAVFVAPLQLDTFGATATWAREAGGLAVKVQELAFANADTAGSARGEWRSLPRGAGWVDLTGSFSRAEATSVHRYLPLGIPERVRRWVEHAVLSGRLTQADFKVKGDLWDFPFRDPGQGTFEVTAALEGGTLDFADHWPRIEDIRAGLRFAGYTMEIDAPEARTGGARLARVVARIPDLSVEPARLEVRGEAGGSTEAFLKYIDASPVARWTGGATADLRAHGQGALALRLDIPIDHYDQTRVAGTFTFADNAILVTPQVPRIEKASGRVTFTEREVRGAEIAGEVFGGAVAGGFEIADGPLRFTARGTADVARVREAYELPLADRVQGRTDWRLEGSIGRAGAAWTVESSLVGVSVALPAPLAKPPESEIAFRLRRTPDGPEADLFDAAYGDVARLRARRRLDTHAARVERAAIVFGSGPVALDRAGIWVRGRMPRLDLTEWTGIYGAIADAGAAPATPGAGAPLEDGRFAGIDLRLGELVLLGRSFPDQALLARPRAGGWAVELDGPRLSGRAQWTGAAPGSIVARLARVDLPADSTPAVEVAAPPERAPDYPALDVVVDRFVRKAHELGTLTVRAQPAGADWNIETLRLSNPAGELRAHGRTRRTELPVRTELELELDIADVGEYLRRLGLPEGIKGAKGRIAGRLGWTRELADLDYASLDGRRSVSAKGGQFTRMDPGIGKLLGVLSLQSIPRRITLDFKDVFSEGFAFDAIDGEVKVSRGVLVTDGLRIAGPAAKVLMAGEADLSSETQNLKVRVQPTLSAGVAAGALAITGNPLVGGAVLLGQALLRDPIEQILASEYRVTGSWADPQVEKIVAAGPVDATVPR